MQRRAGLVEPIDEILVTVWIFAGVVIVDTYISFSEHDDDTAGVAIPGTRGIDKVHASVHQRESASRCAREK